MKKVTEGDGHKFWQFLQDIHLYDSKGEALFKAFVIAFSWVGAVYVDKLPETISIAIAANIFLFSLSLIMEYAMRLITTNKILTRILPGIIVLVSCVCAIAAFSELLEKPFGLNWECIYHITAIMVLVIVVDVILYVIINGPPKGKIETKLRKVEVNW